MHSLSLFLIRPLHKAMRYSLFLFLFSFFTSLVFAAPSKQNLALATASGTTSQPAGGGDEPLVRDGWNVTAPLEITMCKPFQVGFSTPAGVKTKSVDLFTNNGTNWLQNLGTIPSNMRAGMLWFNASVLAVETQGEVTIRVGQVRNEESGYAKQHDIKVLPYKGDAKKSCIALGDLDGVSQAKMVVKYIAI
ncbi:hypothetical protein T439DRAFT_248610 [Meredithblackwellia eburnea MCA 4105]